MIFNKEDFDAWEERKNYLSLPWSEQQSQEWAWLEDHYPHIAERASQELDKKHILCEMKRLAKLNVKPATLSDPAFEALCAKYRKP